MHQELLEFTAQAFTVQALLVPDTAHVVLYIGNPGRLVSEVSANALLALMFVDVLQAVAVAGRRRQLCDLLAWDLGALPPDTSFTVGYCSRASRQRRSRHTLFLYPVSGRPAGSAVLDGVDKL